MFITAYALINISIGVKFIIDFRFEPHSILSLKFLKFQSVV